MFNPTRPLTPKKAVSPDREILQRLTTDGWLRGLELVRASEAGGGNLGRGSIYIRLAQLEDAGLVRSREERAPVDPRIGIARLEYQRTSAGNAALLRDDL